MVSIELKKAITLDTSSLMHDANVLDKLLNQGNKVILNNTVVEELDHLKKDGINSGKAYKARKAISSIKRNLDNPLLEFNLEKTVVPELKVQIDVYNYNDNDNIIISCAKIHNCYLMTDDLNVKIKANAIGVDILENIKTKERYTGYKHIYPTEEEWQKLFTDYSNNIFDCKTNEYVILHNADDKICNILVWDGNKYNNITYKTFESQYTKQLIEPINLEQKLAFDMLQNNKIPIKVLTGVYGSGKDFLMISNALKLIENKKYNRILWVRNNIEVKDTKPIGFLPNGVIDKLLPFAEIISDHVGGENKLKELVSQNKIEIEHLGFMRGRDIKDTIIICSEAENTTKEQMQMLISRVGKNSALWLNGDYHQVDERVFEENNGLTRVIDKLQGQPSFGFVEFTKTERSEAAKLADLLD